MTAVGQVGCKAGRDEVAHVFVVVFAGIWIPLSREVLHD
jgi:hypothetical protein